MELGFSKSVSALHRQEVSLCLPTIIFYYFTRSHPFAFIIGARESMEKAHHKNCLAVSKLKPVNLKNCRKHFIDKIDIKSVISEKITYPIIGKG